MDSGVGAEFDSDDGIKFGIDNKYNMGSSEYFFDSFNYGKTVVSLIDEPTKKMELYFIYMRLAEKLILVLEEFLVEVLVYPLVVG